MSDDFDDGWFDEVAAEADYQHEMAIAQHLADLEREDYDRAKSYTWG